MSKASIENLIALLRQGQVSKDELMRNISKIQFDPNAPELPKNYDKELLRSNVDLRGANKNRKILKRTTSLQNVTRSLPVPFRTSAHGLSRGSKCSVVSLCENLSANLILEDSSEDSSSHCDGAACSSGEAAAGRNAGRCSSKTFCEGEKVECGERRTVEVANAGELGRNGVAVWKRKEDNEKKLVANDKVAPHNEKRETARVKRRVSARTKPNTSTETPRPETAGRAKAGRKPTDSCREPLPAKTVNPVSLKQVKLKCITAKKCTLNNCESVKTAFNKSSTKIPCENNAGRSRNNISQSSLKAKSYQKKSNIPADPYTLLKSSYQKTSTPKFQPANNPPRKCPKVDSTPTLNASNHKLLKQEERKYGKRELSTSRLLVIPRISTESKTKEIINKLYCKMNDCIEIMGSAEGKERKKLPIRLTKWVASFRKNLAKEYARSDGKHAIKDNN